MHKQVPLQTTNRRQSKSVDQASNVFPSGKSDFNLNSSDLTTKGEIAGRAVQLLVDTGACVSAIDEQFFTKIYGQFPPKMSDGSLSSVQTVRGEKVPVLRKITIPLQLNGKECPCEFHVMQNGALIDLVDSTLSFKGAGNLGKHASTRRVPVMGTFLPQQKKLNEKKAVATDVDPAPF